MKQIILNKCEDGVIWVTSDDDMVGTETTFREINDECEQFMIALADFLGFEPSEVLNLEDNNFDI